MTRKRALQCLLVGLVCGILAHFIVRVQATWKPEYADADPAVQDWYRNAELTPAAQGRLHFKSCCASSDVVRTRFRVNSVDGADEWEWLDGSEWEKIPADIVHQNEHAPDGQATLFAIGHLPTCFFPPEGGI